MGASAAPVLSRTDEQQLHQQLLTRDPLASSELARLYLAELVTWVKEHNRLADPMLCDEAADQAIVSLIQRPESYRPERQSLEVYLRMSAQADLKNLLRRERKHSQRQISLSGVELSDERGKYLGRDDDPARPLEIQEAMQQAISMTERAGLNDMENRVLDLLLQNERRTAMYAQVCGLEHLPADEQAREVKRIKDRLKKRLKRGRDLS